MEGVVVETQDAANDQVGRRERGRKVRRPAWEADHSLRPVSPVRSERTRTTGEETHCVWPADSHSDLEDMFHRIVGAGVSG